MKDLFHATSRERRVRLVSITGVAGIGKSRLAWEFLKYVDGAGPMIDLLDRAVGSTDAAYGHPVVGADGPADRTNDEAAVRVG